MDSKEKEKLGTKDSSDNVEDSDEFSDTDDLCNTSPLEKVQALEDLVSTTSQPGIVKVNELQSQINNFEAEMEGGSVKKGKMRYPSLTHIETHVETALARHKACIVKLELMLRLMKGTEPPEQVNEAKGYLEEYVKQYQEEFDEFSVIDDLCNTSPLEKVEAHEDLVSTTSQAFPVNIDVTNERLGSSADLGFVDAVVASGRAFQSQNEVVHQFTRDLVEIEILPRLAEFYVLKTEGGLGVWKEKSVVRFFPPADFLGTIEQIIGHSDGLLCVLCKYDSYFVALINPWTEKYSEIWLDADVYPTIGFGGEGDNAKLVQVKDSVGVRHVTIYDVKAGLWREGPKQNQVGDILEGGGILVDNLICWQLKSPAGDYVARYNIDTDRWDRYVPLERIGNVCHLCEFEGSLCATAFQEEEGTQSIWLLKDDAWSPLLNYEAMEDIPLPLAFPVGCVDRGIIFAFKLSGPLVFYVCDAYDRRQPRFVRLEKDVLTFEIDSMRLSATRMENEKNIETLKEEAESFFPMPPTFSLKQFMFHIFRKVLVE